MTRTPPLSIDPDRFFVRHVGSTISAKASEILVDTIYDAVQEAKSVVNSGPINDDFYVMQACNCAEELCRQEIPIGWSEFYPYCSWDCQDWADQLQRLQENNSEANGI